MIRDPPPGKAWEVSFGPRVGKALVEAVVNDLFKGREGEVLELSEESVAEAFRRIMSPELNRLIDALPG